jgi:protoheme IX farnesyltransferase
MVASAAFLYAAGGTVEIGKLLALLGGVSLVIGSACALNNYVDRGIDRRMTRTKTRALAAGSIPVRNALVYSAILGVTGFLLLALYTNWLTVMVGIIGYLFYVVIYGLAKRKTVYGTIVGSVSGSIPPVAGYTAVTAQLDTTALLLFLILVFWQMPHFYAIAMYRVDDYKRAGLPVLSVVKGMKVAKVHILSYIVGFIFICVMLAAAGKAGATYAVLMTVIGAYWLWRGLHGLKLKDDIRWARMMFGLSLLVMVTFSVAISLDPWLP